VTGSSVTGSSATGSSATGSSATGSSATGSSVTGSSATGSSATGSNYFTSAFGPATGDDICGSRFLAQQTQLTKVISLTQTFNLARLPKFILKSSLSHDYHVQVNPKAV